MSRTEEIWSENDSSGTLDEIFAVEQDPLPPLPGLSEEDRKSAEEVFSSRDDDINRLTKVIFLRAGVAKNQIRFCYIEDWATGRKLRAETKGYLMTWGCDASDPIISLYRNGKPLAAVYFSCRGGLYQGEAYLATTKQHFYAHNFTHPDLIKERGEAGTWVEVKPMTPYNIAEEGLNMKEGE